MFPTTVYGVFIKVKFEVTFLVETRIRVMIAYVDFYVRFYISMICTFGAEPASVRKRCGDA